MGGRYRTSYETPTQETQLDWPALLEEALTIPGRMSDTYSRFHDYSYLNQLLLLRQGVREPVASFARWKALGRHVMKGERGHTIIRPITVKSKTELDEQGNPVLYTKFKDVRGAFGYSQTDGPEIPEPQPREWSKERALGALAITQAPFTDIDGNKAGYAIGRTIHVSPVAKYPLKTIWHETAHIVHGHTGDEFDYQEHRGLAELEAESSAYLGLHEIGADEHMDAAESRAYIQNWIGNETPPDASIRRIFKVVDQILKAGRVPLETDQAIAS